MFQLQNNPAWSLLVKAVRWILSFLLAGIIAFPAGAAELGELRSIFAFTGDALYFNTAYPGGSAWIRIWPVDGGEGAQTMLLPTENGGTIEAVFNASDGSPLGNWYDTVTGNVVYHRPDNGYYFVWNPNNEEFGYSIQLPGAAAWMNAAFVAMENTFKTDSGGQVIESVISWDAANGWYVVEGAPAWQRFDIALPPTPFNVPFDPPLDIALALIPRGRPTGIGVAIFEDAAGNRMGISGQANPASVRAELYALDPEEGGFAYRIVYEYIFESPEREPGWYSIDDHGQYASIAAPDTSTIGNVVRAEKTYGTAEGLDDVLVLAGGA